MPILPWPVLSFFSQNIAQTRMFAQQYDKQSIARMFCSHLEQNCTKVCTVFLLFLLHKVLFCIAVIAQNFALYCTKFCSCHSSCTNLNCVQMCFLYIKYYMPIVLLYCIHLFCVLHTIALLCSHMGSRLISAWPLQK